MADDQRSPDGGDPFNPGVRIERLPPLACWSLQAEPSCWAALRLAAGLGDVAYAALLGAVDAVTEGEECIRTKRHTR